MFDNIVELFPIVGLLSNASGIVELLPILGGIVKLLSNFWGSVEPLSNFWWKCWTVLSELMQMGLSNYCQTGVIQALLVQFRVCSGKSKLWSPTEFWRVFHSPKTYIASRFFWRDQNSSQKTRLVWIVLCCLSFPLPFWLRIWRGWLFSRRYRPLWVFVSDANDPGFFVTQQLTWPLAQNPWPPKDHNGHNSLENPSPKTRGNPRTTMDTTA